MSKYSGRIQEILSNANSKKVFDKKRCVLDLLDLYNNEEAVQEISSNSEQDIKSTQSWSYITHIVHKLLINDADRSGSKDTYRTQTDRQKLCSLMWKTVQNANHGIPLLQSSDLVPLILQILRTKSYEHYYNTYMSILVTYVLPFRIYHVAISYEQWVELLKLCGSVYKDGPSYVNKRPVLEAIKMIVDFGCLHSNLIIHVKKMLPFLDDIFLDGKMNPDTLLEPVYAVIYAVCRQIATECRIALCQFSEKLCRDIIVLNNTEEKHQLLLLFVKIHHPKGVSTIHAGASAYNWEQWKMLLKSMCLMIQKDCKEDMLSKAFVHLAAEVYKQILESADCTLEENLSDDGCYKQAPKRRRISYEVNGLIDMISGDKPEKAWPMVQVITVLLEKYPKCLKSEHFDSFLQTVVELLTQSCKNENIMNSLYNLCTVLMKNERLFPMVDIESSNIHWSKIWNILLRSLNMNQNEVSGHTLVQTFILHNKILDTNALLRLYLTNVITWSVTSLRTLRLFCEHLSVPVDLSMFNINLYPTSNTSSVRLNLLKWILNIPWQNVATRIPVDELCSLIIGIILKSRYQNKMKFNAPDMNLTCNCSERETADPQELKSFEEVEHCYLLLTYNTNFYDCKQEQDVECDTKITDSILHIEELLNFVTENLSLSIKDDCENDISTIIIKIAIIAKVISILKRLNIVSGDLNEFPLVCLMKTHLAHVCALLVNIYSSTITYLHLFNIIKALNTLYSTVYDTDVAKIIVSSFTPDTLKNLFSLMNIEDTKIMDYRASIDFDDAYSTFQSRRKRTDKRDVNKSRCYYCTKSIIRSQATKVLTLFCCINVGEEKCEIQATLIKNLLTLDMYDLKDTGNLNMVTTVLELLPKYGNKELHRNHKDMPIQVLIELFKQCRKDEMVVRRILRILPYFFEYATEHNIQTQDFINILIQFPAYFNENKFGFKVYVEYFKCLSKISQIDPTFFNYDSRFRIFNGGSIVEDILPYFRHPLYGVRLQAIQCIKDIYSLKNVDFQWKESFFKKMEHSIKQLFALEKRTNNEDEKEARIASTLHLLTTIIYSNGTLQCQALSIMLSLNLESQVEIHTIRKALDTIESRINYKQLIEQNISYLLLHWYNTKCSLEDFPWTLTECESQKQFYEVYINVLTLLQLQIFDITAAMSLCKYIGQPYEKVVENIFPQILCWLLYCKVSGNNTEEASRMLCKLQSNKDEFATVTKFTTLFQEMFEQILTYVILRLHDEKYLDQIFEYRASISKSDPPHFNKEAVDMCLKYIEMNYVKEGSLTRALVTKYTDVLQKIFLRLVSNIYEANFLEHKLKSFHQYIYFCTMITQELQNKYYDTMSMYIVREIGCSVLHLTKIDDDVISDLACKYFYIFVQQLFPARSKEVNDILNFVIMILMPIAQVEKTPVALRILRFLIIDQKNLLYDAIGKLNAFPDLPVFQEIRNVHNALKYETAGSYNLQREIQHFLHSVHDKNANCSIEDILHLRLQLATRNEELQEMYNKLERLRDFAEDCASSMLHQLVHKLIKLTKSSDKKISIEAAKCLGELGPIDLRMMILHMGICHCNETSELLEIFSYKVITFLTEFLIHADIELRIASANALYAIFKTFWGQKLTKTNNLKSLKHTLGESQIPLRLDYIRPFITSENIMSTCLKIDDQIMQCVFNKKNEIWTAKSENDYTEWMIEVTCNVATCFIGFYFKCLIPICKLNIDFCELILPRIIFLAIYLDKNSVHAICSCIDQFFDYHFRLRKENISGQKMTNCDHQIVHCMLNIVNYIRIQIADNTSLKLNYMYVAKAAQYCSAFCTAILYSEIACENIVADSYNFSNIPKIDYMHEYKPEDGKIIQDILRDAYSKIGDPDAICGTGSSHLYDSSSRVQYYIHTKKWDKVMVAMDVEMSSGNSGAFRVMANSLYQSGLQYSLNDFIFTTSNAGVKVDDDILYEHAWRLSNWNLCQVNNALRSQVNCDVKCNITENDYDFNHYQALKFFHESNDSGVRNASENARRSIIKALRNISLESSKTIYEKLMQLQLIREIEELYYAKQKEYKNVLKKWKLQDTANLNEFQYIEPILTQRTVMYQINEILSNNSIIKDALAHTYLEIANIAVDQEHLLIASRALAVMAKLPDLPPKIQDELLYQESLLARRGKDLQIGRFLMRRLIQKPSIDPVLRANVLRVYGDWMAETKSENPQTIIEKYYLESIKICTTYKLHDNLKSLNEAQVALARFADAQYAEIRKYLNSPQFETFKESVNYATKDIDIDPRTEDQDIRRAVFINKKQNTNDAAQLEHIQKEMKYYLKLALQNYIRTLQKCNNYDLLIFRVIALWLDNTDDDEINEFMKMELTGIQSYKFIPVISQIGSRMSTINNKFSTQVTTIMDRCAREHPYHTLPVLLGLKNLYGDYEFSSTQERANVKEESRVLAAKQLTEKLIRSNVVDIIQQMDRFSHAIVMLAYHKLPKSESKSVIKIPLNQEILKIKNLDKVMVPTFPIPIRPNGNYDNIIGIASYMPTYERVGGVNAPKRVTCIGTDGIARHQLVKGGDDLRQDAIMQQVFDTINILLKTCKETSRRKLSFRTYKVLPLTQRSGIIEWCNNTSPIVNILVGPECNSGLHAKYYPNDYSANLCRKKLLAAAKTSKDEKLKVFEDCSMHMHPVLHHFFAEKYPSPQTWYERRVAFTRSVATTSMAGYILGLGDRHLSNILIDETTAEVIHIDFGIAFEQGKLLPIPETVPFRLTRNIEAAMGVSGVEGTMRRCCEETLTVLRNQREIIITLLQVLLYDPLFTWAITPDKAHTLQNAKSTRSTTSSRGVTEINKLAERALLRVEQKLQGIEDGVASSIPGQVERLIQQARDPSNLSQLYCGWQPYL